MGISLKELERAGLRVVAKQVFYARGTVQQAEASYLESLRPHPLFQEPENAGHADTGPQARASNADHKARKAKAHGRDHGKFHLTITLRFSDRIRRDPDGIFSTLCDCLLRARRRLLDEAQGNPDQVRTVPAGRRRRHTPYRAPVGKLPF